MDNFLVFSPDLSKIQAFVHTSLRRISEISWKLLRIIVTLHYQKLVTYFIILFMLKFN